MLLTNFTSFLGRTLDLIQDSTSERFSTQHVMWKGKGLGLVLESGIAGQESVSLHLVGINRLCVIRQADGRVCSC
jgi:hypothetical protein